jgi:anti-anti-sigma factor
MEIRECREGDVLVLAPDGSVAGIEETSAIETKLVTSLKAGFRQIVLDCAAAGQLTSAAIRVLLLTSSKLDRIEGRLVLCGMNAKLRKAFAISGFDKDFTIVATREEALQRVLEPVPPRPSRKEKKEKPSAAVVESPSPVPVVPTEPPPPATDVRDAIASALLDALGVSAAGANAARSSPIAPLDFDSLASGLLAALRVGQP